MAASSKNCMSYALPGSFKAHRQLYGKQQLHQPQEEYEYQDRDKAGGDQHDRQGLHEAVHQVPQLIGDGGGRAGHLVQEPGEEALFIGPLFPGGLLHRRGGVLGVLDGGLYRRLIGILDHGGDLHAGRDRRHQGQAEDGQLHRQHLQPRPAQEQVCDAQAAQDRDQPLEGHIAGHGQQVFLQQDGAEHHQEGGAQVRQLLRDGVGRVPRDEGEGRGCRSGGGGEPHGGGLLLLQRSDALRVEVRGGGDPRHHEEGEEPRHQQEGCRHGPFHIDLFHSVMLPFFHMVGRRDMLHLPPARLATVLVFFAQAGPGRSPRSGPLDIQYIRYPLLAKEAGSSLLTLSLRQLLHCP